MGGTIRGGFNGRGSRPLRLRHIHLASRFCRAGMPALSQVEGPMPAACVAPLIVWAHRTASSRACTALTRSAFQNYLRQHCNPTRYIRDIPGQQEGCTQVARDCPWPFSGDDEYPDCQCAH